MTSSWCQTTSKHTDEYKVDMLFILLLIISNSFRRSGYITQIEKDKVAHTLGNLSHLILLTFQLAVKPVFNNKHCI